MKHYLVMICMFLIVVACVETETTQTKVNVQELHQNDYSLDEPQVICGSRSAQLAHAAWSKSDLQLQHLLIVKHSSGNEKQFTLGIDRSPDFLFRPGKISLAEHHFYYAHSRLVAYSCIKHELAEVRLVYPDNFEAQDAQSGMITSLKKTDENTLQLEIVDAGTLEFLVSPTQIEQVLEP